MILLEDGEKRITEKKKKRGERREKEGKKTKHISTSVHKTPC